MTKAFHQGQGRRRSWTNRKHCAAPKLGLSEPKSRHFLRRWRTKESEANRKRSREGDQGMGKSFTMFPSLMINDWTLCNTAISHSILIHGVNWRKRNSGGLPSSKEDAAAQSHATESKCTIFEWQESVQSRTSQLCKQHRMLR